MDQPQRGFAMVLFSFPNVFLSFLQSFNGLSTLTVCVYVDVNVCVHLDDEVNGVHPFSAFAFASL